MKLESLYTHPEQKQTLKLKHAPGVELQVLGIDSLKYKAALGLANAKELAVGDQSDEVYYSEKEVERRHVARCQLISTLIVGWKGIDEKYSKENAFKLCLNSPKTFVEIDAFCGNRENFT